MYGRLLKKLSNQCVLRQTQTGRGPQRIFTSRMNHQRRFLQRLCVPAQNSQTETTVDYRSLEAQPRQCFSTYHLHSDHLRGLDKGCYIAADTVRPRFESDILLFLKLLIRGGQKGHHFEDASTIQWDISL